MKLASYINREDRILNLCRNRRVLHLGCVGFTDSTTQEKVGLARESLHASVSAISTCEGVDLDEAAVRFFRDNGIFDNVRCGDVEELAKIYPSGAEFDVVLAGDIIEHLSNPGRMLDGVRILLAQDGVLVISTPNAFGLPAYLRFLTGRFREGMQHVLCFNPVTLSQLLERHGFEVISADACYQRRAKKSAGPLFGLFAGFLSKFPQLGGTLLFVCKVRRPSI